MRNTDPWIVFSHSFTVLCTLVACILVIWCLWEYSKDEDVVEIIFRSYGEDEECIYPDITLCYESPYETYRLQRFDKNISKYRYTAHLLGQDFVGNWDKNILKIDYHNVSLQLDDYLIGKPLYTTSKILDMNKTIDRNDSTSFPGYKCFTYHLPPLVRILGVSFAIRNSVFETGYRPQNGFDLVLHYPQQKMLAWQFVTSNWKKRNNETSKSYQTIVGVKDVEVIRRRNKRKYPCSSTNSSDEESYHYIMESIGCYPPFAHKDKLSKFPPCTTKEELNLFRIMFHEALSHSGDFAHATPICNTIQKIGVDIEDTDFHVGKLKNGSEADPNLDVDRIMQVLEDNGKKMFSYIQAFRILYY